MKIVIEKKPTELWKPLALVIGVAVVAIAISTGYQALFFHDRIITWWAFCLWGVTAFIIWHQHFNLDAHEFVAEADITKEDLLDAIDIKQSVKMTRRQIEEVVRLIGEAKAKREAKHAAAII